MGHCRNSTLEPMCLCPAAHGCWSTQHSWLTAAMVGAFCPHDRTCRKQAAAAARLATHGMNGARLRYRGRGPTSGEWKPAVLEDEDCLQCFGLPQRLRGCLRDILWDVHFCLCMLSWHLVFRARHRPSRILCMHVVSQQPARPPYSGCRSRCAFGMWGHVDGQ